MTAMAMLRSACLLGLLGLASGCNLILGVPNLADPDNVATMTGRFKATIQSELRDPAPLDWGAADDRIWFHYKGPQAVTFCGRPANAPATQRPYEISFFRGSFGGIGMHEAITPAQPPTDPAPGFCDVRPRDLGQPPA